MKNAYNTSAYGSFAYVYDIFMDIIRHNYKLLVCLDSKDCLSRLFRQENYHKRILGRWLVGNAFFEQCIFER
jgi:hypothetical protein